MAKLHIPARPGYYPELLWDADTQDFGSWITHREIWSELTPDERADIIEKIDAWLYDVEGSRVKVVSFLGLIHGGEHIEFAWEKRS